MSDIIFATMYGFGDDEEAREHGTELKCIEVEFTPESLNSNFNHKDKRVDFRAYRPSTALHIADGIAAKTLPWRREEMDTMPRIERLAYEDLIERVQSIIKMERNSGTNIDLVVLGYPVMIVSKKESMTAPPKTPQEVLQKHMAREDEHHTAHVKISYMGFELVKKATIKDLFFFEEPVRADMDVTIREVEGVADLKVDIDKGMWSYRSGKLIPIGCDDCSGDAMVAVLDRTNLDHLKYMTRHLRNRIE